METGLTVRRAGAADRDALIAAYTAANADEAVFEWISAGYPVEAIQAGFVRELIDTALAEDEIWVAGPGAEIWTVSIWQTLTDLDRATAAAVETRAQADALPDVRSVRRAAEVMELLAREHPREFPHGYLQIVVTRPEHRGKGSTSAILADRLKAASDRGLPVFLEASTERSARLYARHGFTAEPVTHELPESGPTLRPMWFRG
ncbi:GNAT family N-acetyltransferase [Nocardia arthritidis]|nr:GNAT family N-acetyltransferase [Nocardia arthritidis]